MVTIPNNNDKGKIKYESKFSFAEFQGATDNFSI